MATEKLAEGIRKFAADARTLEKLVDALLWIIKHLLISWKMVYLRHSKEYLFYMTRLCTLIQ